MLSLILTHLSSLLLVRFDKNYLEAHGLVKQCVARFDGVGWDCQWLVKSAETRSKKSMAVWVKDRVKVIDNPKKNKMFL